MKKLIGHAQRGLRLASYILLIASVSFPAVYAADETKPLVALLPVVSSDGKSTHSWLPSAIFHGFERAFQQMKSIELIDPKVIEEAFKAEKLKPGKSIEDSRAQTLGRRLKADVLILATYQLSSDEKVSLAVKLIEPASSVFKETLTSKAKLDGLLSTLSKLTVKAASTMNYRLSSNERRAIKNPPTSSFRAFSDYQRALHAYDARAGTGNLSEAVALLTNAVKRDPHFAEARFQLGLLAARQGQTDQAASHLQRLVKDKDTYPDIQHNLGLAKLNQGDYSAAQRELQKAYQVNPRRVNLLNDLALANYYLRDFKSAQVHLSAASKLAPDSSVIWNNVGAVAYAQGDFVEAQKAYLKAIQHNPKSVSSHYNLGLTLLHLAEMDKAKKAFEKTLELDPRHVKSYYSLALIAESDGTGKAAAYWKKYLELSKADPAEQPFVAFAQRMLSESSQKSSSP